jgi:hypothetical protein
VTVTYPQIEKRFNKLRRYITGDLRRLVKQPKGGQYLAAFLIACACETVGWFKYGNNQSGARVLAGELLPPKFRRVAPSLYDAMRNGIAHRYETKTICIGDKRLDIGISWRKKPHLGFSRRKDVIFLNVQLLARQVYRMFSKYKRELEADAALREKFYESMNRKWEKKFDNPREKQELEAWERLLVGTC